MTEAGCELADVVKAMVWLRDRSDFPGFNAAFAEYFPTEPPAPPRFLINCLSTYEWN